MPQFEKHLLGIRYRQSSFSSHLNQGSTLFATTEEFRAAELYGRFYLGERWQLLATLPYNYNNQRTATQEKKLSGLGDASLLVNYRLLDASTSMNNKLLKHQLWLGGGLRLPTGNSDFNELDAGQVANPNFQLGSGSLGYIGQLNYTARLAKVGFTATGLAEYWHPNAGGYQFGKRFGGAGNLFYIKQIKNWGLMPSLGAQYSYAYRNRQDAEQLRQTGGQLLLATAGLDVFLGKIAGGFAYNHPLSQSLAAGHIQANAAYTAHLSWLF
jgi:hypothetical protein